MRNLRHFPSGSLIEVTTRTVQGQLLLAPSPALNQIILGVLGRAQRLYGVRVHAYSFASHHYHLLLTVDSARQLNFPPKRPGPTPFGESRASL